MGGAWGTEIETRPQPSKPIQTNNDGPAFKRTQDAPGKRERASSLHSCRRLPKAASPKPCITAAASAKAEETNVVDGGAGKQHKQAKRGRRWCHVRARPATA